MLSFLKSKASVTVQNYASVIGALKKKKKKRRPSSDPLKIPDLRMTFRIKRGISSLLMLTISGFLRTYKVKRF